MFCSDCCQIPTRKLWSVKPIVHVVAYREHCLYVAAFPNVNQLNLSAEWRFAHIGRGASRWEWTMSYMLINWHHARQQLCIFGLHISYLCSAGELDSLNGQNKKVWWYPSWELSDVNNRPVSLQICELHSTICSLSSLFMRSLTFVETTERLVEISAVAASHDWLHRPRLLK